MSAIKFFHKYSKPRLTSIECLNAEKHDLIAIFHDASFHKITT